MVQETTPDSINTVNKNEQFIAWSDKAMAGTFYALIYFLPISIALSEICTGFALFFFLLKRGGMFYGLQKGQDQEKKSFSLLFKNFKHAFKPYPNILNIPIGVVLIASLISVANSQYLIHSIEGFVGKVLQSVFLYLNFIECMRTRKRIRIFLTVFSVSCTLICINGFYQSIVGKGFIFENVFDGRISSSFRHANDFAAYLTVVIPVFLCLSILNGGKRVVENGGGSSNEFEFFTKPEIKMVLLVLFAFSILCFGLTYSRGAWVGFILSLVISSLLAIRNRRVLLTFGCLIAAFLVIFYPKMVDVRTPLLNIGTSLARNNRFVYWDRAYEIIKDYPIFGCGLNSYALVEGRYSVGWGGYPHNSYLQMAAETGLVGISAFLWMLFVLIRDSIFALQRIKIQTNKMLFFGFLTGLLGFLIHSFFDTNFYSVQLGSLFWIIMGVLVSLQKIEAT